MAGLVTLSATLTSTQTIAAINAMFTELFGADQAAPTIVANMTALAAIPAYDLMSGKLVYVLDTDGLGTSAWLRYNLGTTSWATVPQMSLSVVDATTGAVVNKVMTTAQRLAIVAPVAGLTVWDSSLSAWKIWTGGAWV